MFRRFRIAVEDFKREGKYYGEGDRKVHCFSAADLMKYHFLEVPAEHPKWPYCREGEWYCQNTRCGVRYVQLQIKGDEHPREVVCPVCRKPLKFHHFLKSVELLPVEPGTPDPPPAVPEPSVN